MPRARERILARARRIYRRQGIGAVSMRAVSGAAGLSPMAIYRHFRNKAELVDAIAAEALAAWECRVQAIAAESSLHWLRAAAAAYLDFALGDPRRFEAAFLWPRATARKLPDDFAAGRSPAGREVLLRIQRALDAGMLRGGTALEIGMVLWATAHGLILLYRAGRFSASPAAFQRLYLEAIERVLDSFRRRRLGGGRRPPVARSGRPPRAKERHSRNAPH